MKLVFLILTGLIFTIQANADCGRFPNPWVCNPSVNQDYLSEQTTITCADKTPHGQIFLKLYGVKSYVDLTKEYYATIYIIKNNSEADYKTVKIRAISWSVVRATTEDSSASLEYDTQLLTGVYFFQNRQYDVKCFVSN